MRLFFESWAYTTKEAEVLASRIRPAVQANAT